jgi:hypothetical protein
MTSKLEIEFQEKLDSLPRSKRLLYYVISGLLEALPLSLKWKIMLGDLLIGDNMRKSIGDLKNLES